MVARRLRPAGEKASTTITDEVAADAQLLEDFWVAREQQLLELFGRPALRRSGVRDVLLRYVVLRHHEGAAVRLHDCVVRCADLASVPTIRREIELMEYCGVVGLVRATSDQRSVLVTPTARLIRFYNTQMPKLADEFARLMRARNSAAL